MRSAAIVRFIKVGESPRHSAISTIPFPRPRSTRSLLSKVPLDGNDHSPHDVTCQWQKRQ